MCLNTCRSLIQYCVSVVTKRPTLENREFVAGPITAVPLLPRTGSSNTPAVVNASLLWGQNINFLPPKKCNPNPPIINYDQWSLRLNFCLTPNSDGHTIFTGSRRTNEPRANIRVSCQSEVIKVEAT
jgi:hypothetical protein